MGKEKKKATFEWIKVLGVGIIVAIFLRTFFFSTYIVDGESMMPTLESGDLVVINKFRVSENSLERGDIVVFHVNEEEDYVKRIIGLPGDKIEYKEDVLYVNGERQDESYLDEYKIQNSNRLITGTFTLYDLTGEYVVPDGAAFVMGDNRLESYDSRYFGFIDMDQIVGTLDLRYWPIEHAGIQFD